ncbi:hypothetical protein BKA56DRAFT_687309 [Ilyonectria sp. MPI-CAGE-AT-0026]|nr:hypothetical protein BKA56DRAFT_687309 [Ilyonectria sp. MPI-CAGE-AT-0026]
MPPSTRSTRSQKRSIADVGDGNEEPATKKTNAAQQPAASDDASASTSAADPNTPAGVRYICRGPNGEGFMPHMIPKEYLEAIKKMPIPFSWIGGVDASPGREMTTGDREWWESHGPWLEKNKKAMKLKDADWKLRDEAMAKEVPRKEDEGYEAFDFICMRKPRGPWEDPEPEPPAGMNPIGKLASRFPDYKWDRSQWWMLEGMKRDPDEFGMHIYKHFGNYGKFEVMENIFLHFSTVNKPSATYRELWPVEGIALTIRSDVSDFIRSDDPDKSCMVIELVGTILITALNFLKEHDLLNATSPILNIGLVVAIFVEWGWQLANDFSIFKKSAFWVHVVVPMVEEAGITMTGPDGFEKLLEKVKSNAGDLGNAEAKMWKTPWSTKAASFNRKHASSSSRTAKAKLGGTHYDITLFSAAERKKHSLR